MFYNSSPSPSSPVKEIDEPSTANRLARPKTKGGRANVPSLKMDDVK